MEVGRCVGGVKGCCDVVMCWGVEGVGCGVVLECGGVLRCGGLLGCGGMLGCGEMFLHESVLRCRGVMG